jgi:hypothetical protein
MEFLWCLATAYLIYKFFKHFFLAMEQLGRTLLIIDDHRKGTYGTGVKV